MERVPLNRYAKRILEIFRESFPEAAHYRGGRKLRKGGWDTIFPEVLDDVDAKEDFLHAVDVLCGAGIVSVKWRHRGENDRVEALYLEDPRQLYEAAGADFPGDVRRKLIELLTGWRPRTETARAVKEHTRARLEAFQPLLLGSGDPSRELADVMRLLDLHPGESAGIPLRALSVRIFNDSKRIEAIRKTADTLARTALGISLTESLGLDRSYPEASFALRGSLRFADGAVWPIHGRMVTLPLKTLGGIAGIELASSRPRVLSIENKETFSVFPAAGSGFDGCLYTGGHLNPAVTKTLELFAASDAEIHHFGDLDPDGLIIFEEVARAAGGALPYRMDTVTYLRYLPFGYELTENQLKRLDLVSLSDLVDLKNLILEHKRGVEQEVIDPYSGSDSSKLP